MTSSKINTILKNRKNKNKKGFSLVELIVVLVIMAILAAALVPTLIGYIQQTRQSNAKNEAAACVQAAQTIASAAFADPSGNYVSKSTGKTFKPDDDNADYIAEIENLAEVDTEDEDEDGAEVKSVTLSDNNVVIGLTYKSANGETVTYDDGKYSVGTSAEDESSESK